MPSCRCALFSFSFCDWSSTLLLLRLLPLVGIKGVAGSAFWVDILLFISIVWCVASGVVAERADFGVLTL